MIKAFHVLPNYYSGHTYTWEVSDTFSDPQPWVFTIERSDDGQSGWTDLVPDLENIFTYVDPTKPNKTDKDLDPFYRVRLETSVDTYHSAIRGTYGDLPKRDYLQAREIMRKEHLTMRKKGGVPVHTWKRTKTGIECAACKDPVTGGIIDTNCPECLGSQFKGGYSGPYATWAVFSLRKSHKKFDGLVPEDKQVFNIRVIGHPFINNGDVIVDIVSNRHYIVEDIDDMLEIRRVPIILQLIAYEETTTNIIYKLGEEDRDDDSCGNQRVYS